MTILLIEDDSSVLSLVERLLTAKGHTILCAHDPGDAADGSRGLAEAWVKAEQPPDRPLLEAPWSCCSTIR